jgi:hypothetical protein
MSLLYGDLIQCCVEILRGFDNDSYAVENRVSEFLQDHECLNDHEKTFVKEVFSGCVRFESVLKVVTHGFYNSDGKFALSCDQDLYKVLTYLVLFRLEELGMSHIRKLINSQNIRKTYLFLNFLLNEKHILTWMKDEWNKLYEMEFVQTSLLQPLLKWLPDLHDLLASMKSTLDNKKPQKKVVLPPTDPAPFNITPSKPKKVPMPEQIPMLGPHKPVPSTTYSLPKCHEVLNKAREENKKKSLDRYEWIQNNSLNCFKTEKSPKTLQRMQQITDAENSKLCFEGCITTKPVPTAVLEESVPIKLNAAAILREERLYRKREEEELKKLERLEKGEGDASGFLEWQARMRKLDRERQLEEIEQRRLAGLLSQEEAIIARHKLVFVNKEKVADMKAEAERLMNDYMEQKLVEEERMRRLMEKVIDSHESAKEAKRQLQAYKAKIVQSMNEEQKELMQQALEEAAIEMQQKMELIHQIRAMQASSAAKQPRIVDFTETGGYGLLCEMSIAELRERLRLLEMAEQEEEMAKREQIINDKQSKTQMLLDKLDTISRHRNEITRVAAVRAEERRRQKESKIRPQRPRSDVLTVMEKSLEDRKAERRRLEEELKWGQDQANLSQQRLQQLNAAKKLSENCRWEQLETNTRRSDNVLRTAGMSSRLPSPLTTASSTNVASKTRTALLAL